MRTRRRKEKEPKFCEHCGAELIKKSIFRIIRYDLYDGGPVESCNITWQCPHWIDSIVASVHTKITDYYERKVDTGYRRGLR